VNFPETGVELFATALMELLFQFAKDVGTPKAADEREDLETLMRITQHIMRNFTDLSYNDIETAFELAASYQLRLPKMDDYSPFGQFSSRFVSKFLYAYRPIKAEKLRKSQQKENESTKAKPPNLAKIEKGMKSYLVNAFEGFMKTKVVSVQDPSMIYKWLEERNCINLTETEKNSLILEARRALTKKKPKDSKQMVAAILQNIAQKVNPSTEETKLMEKYALHNLFTHWKNEKVDPKEVIKLIHS